MLLNVILSQLESAFSIDAKITVEAVIKLRELQDFPGFDTLDLKLDKLKEKAGFGLCQTLPLYRIYDDPLSQLPCCIWNWTMYPNSALEPTWKNFFDVLREPGMGLGDLADKVEDFFKSSSKTEITDERDSESVHLVWTYCYYYNVLGESFFVFAVCVIQF